MDTQANGKMSSTLPDKAEGNEAWRQELNQRSSQTSIQSWPLKRTKSLKIHTSANEISQTTSYETHSPGSSAHDVEARHQQAAQSRSNVIVTPEKTVKTNRRCVTEGQLVNVPVDGKQLIVQGFIPGTFHLEPWMMQHFGMKNFSAISFPPDADIKFRNVLPPISSPYLPAVEWEKVGLPPKKDLRNLMIERVQNYVKPDIEIVVAREAFSCHQLVLQCYSSYFDDLPATSKVRLPEEKVTPNAFHLIYDWMISPDPNSLKILKRDNVLEILKASQYLGISDIEEHCWIFLNSEDVFYEETAYLLYIEARRSNQDVVADCMLPRIQKFFLKLVGTDDFLNLDIEEVCKIFSSHYIAVHCELEVFMAGVRWLMHKWEERSGQAYEVMNNVRFGLIDPWQLVDICRNPDNPAFLQVTGVDKVKVLIDEGIAYATTKYGYCEREKKLNNVVKTLRLNEPKPRNWLRGDVEYRTYEEFIVDLNVYQIPTTLGVMEFAAKEYPELSCTPKSSQYNCKEITETSESEEGSL